jgi:hypothetical protein
VLHERSPFKVEEKQPDVGMVMFSLDREDLHEKLGSGFSTIIPTLKPSTPQMIPSRTPLQDGFTFRVESGDLENSCSLT